jgi:hypothetical protein
MSTVRSNKMMGELTNEKQKNINAEKRLVVGTELAGLLSLNRKNSPSQWLTYKKIKLMATRGPNVVLFSMSKFHYRSQIFKHFKF